MSCKSAIYTVNSVGQSYAADSSIPAGTVIRRFGCNCQLDGGAIIVSGAGYFDVCVDVNIAPTAEGEITAQVYKDGQPVSGAFRTVTAVAAGDFVVIPIHCLVRNCGQCCTSTLTVEVDGAFSNVVTTWDVKKQ